MSARAIRYCEAFLRDGLQGWPDQVSTADKLRMIAAIDAAGVPEIDLTAFVSRRLVPQFGDAEMMLAAEGAFLRRVLAVTPDGAERAVSAHRSAGRIDRCGIPFSVSEAHNIANIRRTHAEHREAVARMMDILGAGGIAPLFGAVTAWGCPFRGLLPAEEAMAIAAWGVARGARIVMFGDTTGMADPASVRRLFTMARAEWPDVELIAHFHDNRGLGIANSLAAIESGADTVDGCLGGVGGEPRKVELGLGGDQGNTVSEDLVAMLAAMDIETGINPARLCAAGRLAEDILGRPLYSRVLRAGLASEIGES